MANDTMTNAVPRVRLCRQTEHERDDRRRHTTQRRDDERRDAPPYGEDPRRVGTDADEALWPRLTYPANPAITFQLDPMVGEQGR